MATNRTKNTREDAHDLFEPARIILAAKRLRLTLNLDRTSGECPAEFVSGDNQKQDDENFL